MYDCISTDNYIHRYILISKFMNIQICLYLYIGGPVTLCGELTLESPVIVCL
jgi:hypothetical protein